MAELVELGSSNSDSEPTELSGTLIDSSEIHATESSGASFKVRNFLSHYIAKNCHNPPSASQRKSKPSCSTDPKSVTSLQQVQGFPDEVHTHSIC